MMTFKMVVMGDKIGNVEIFLIFLVVMELNNLVVTVRKLVFVLVLDVAIDQKRFHSFCFISSKGVGLDVSFILFNYFVTLLRGWHLQVSA